MVINTNAPLASGYHIYSAVKGPFCLLVFFVVYSKLFKVLRLVTFIYFFPNLTAVVLYVRLMHQHFFFDKYYKRLKRKIKTPQLTFIKTNQPKIHK